MGYTLPVDRPPLPRPVSLTKPTRLIDGCSWSHPLELLRSEAWGLQQKFDGHRVAIDVAERKVYNRSGYRYEHEDKVLALTGTKRGKLVLDGEYVSTTKSLHIFDIIEINDHPLKDREYEERYAALVQLFERFSSEFGSMSLVPLVVGDERQVALQEIERSGGEGVVFKYRFRPATVATSLPWQVKHKFIKDVDCYVMDVGMDGKKNFELGMYDPEEKDFVSVGRCSALTGDGPRVKVGDVVKVQTLYSTKDGRLFHPTFPKIRTDKLPEECVTEQLAEITTQKDYIYV